MPEFNVTAVPGAPATIQRVTLSDETEGYTLRWEWGTALLSVELTQGELQDLVSRAMLAQIAVAE